MLENTFQSGVPPKLRLAWESGHKFQMPSMGHHNLIILFAIDTKINPDTHGAR